MIVLTKDERKMLLELICNEQVHMIIKDHTKYESNKYIKLEELKVKIKNNHDEDVMKMESTPTSPSLYS